MNEYLDDDRLTELIIMLELNFLKDWIKYPDRFNQSVWIIFSGLVKLLIKLYILGLLNF
jgi:hypothetical protein